MHHGQRNYLECIEETEKDDSDDKLGEQEEKRCSCDVEDPFIAAPRQKNSGP